jgi:hypothetical protein
MQEEQEAQPGTEESGGPIHVPQMPAGDAVEGGTSTDPDPGGGVAEPDKPSAEDVPPEAEGQASAEDSAD